MAAVFPSFPSSNGITPGVLLPYAMPLAIPAGVPSWELTTLLPTTSPETERVPLRFSTPFVLTGLYPSIIFTEQDLAVINPDFFWVALDIDKKVFFTAEGTQTTNATPLPNLVTLSATSVLVRLFNLHLMGATPEIGARFRSKRGAVGSSGFSVPLRICLTAFGYECDRDGNPLPLVR